MTGLALPLPWAGCAWRRTFPVPALRIAGVAVRTTA
jgi:hypothetical protein